MTRTERLLYIVDSYIPTINPWFKSLKTKNDVVSQRRYKLQRILHKRDTKHTLLLFLLYFIQIPIWIAQHKLWTWNITFLLLTILYVYKVVNSADKSDPNNVWVRNGKVVDMKQATDKSGNVNNYIYVRYKDNNQVVEERVGTNTYYSTKINENVCFEFLKPEVKHQNNKDGGFFILFVICLVIGWATFVVENDMLI